MMNKLPSHNVPIVLVADIICYINNYGSSDIGQLKSYSGKSEAYVRSCLVIGKLLHILDEDCLVMNSFVNELGKTPNDELKINIMRKFIQEFNPFLMFVQYHLSGEDLEQAARKVYTIYKFEGKDSLFLKELFISWGTATGIFEMTANGLALQETISSEMTQVTDVDFSLDNEMAIRMYIANILGENAFVTCDSAEIEEFVNAYKKREDDPRGAIECAGRAFEDFLRKIAINVSVDVSGKNGISQVINALYNHKDSSGVLDNKIHSKHMSIGTAIGDIRNMAGHSLEARTLERWRLTSHGAKMYIELVLSAIKSISEYVQYSNFVF